MLKSILEFLTGSTKNFLVSRINKKKIDLSISNTIFTSVMYIESLVGYNGYYKTLDVKSLTPFVDDLTLLKCLPFYKITSLVYTQKTCELQLKIDELVDTNMCYKSIIYDCENDIEKGDFEMRDFIANQYVSENLPILLEISTLIKNRKLITRIKKLQNSTQIKYKPITQKEFKELKVINRNKNLEKNLEKDYKELSNLENVILRLVQEKK